MKYKFIISCFFLLIIAILASACKKDTKGADPPSAHNKPNVVLIYSDDVGYGDISSNGGKSISTPHIDQLAKQGVRFTNAHSAASTCTPSRFSILTGRYAWRKKEPV
jgi:arylsulfatase A-like enzyme